MRRIVETPWLVWTVCDVPRRAGTVVFPFAYTQIAVCSPSRNSFMSGRRPALVFTLAWTCAFVTQLLCLSQLNVSQLNLVPFASRPTRAVLGPPSADQAMCGWGGARSEGVQGFVSRHHA